MGSAVSQPTRQYDFQAGQNAVGDNVDTDLNTLYTVLQGSVGNTHIADDAAVAQNKLATTTLGYAEITSAFSSATGNNDTDVTGLSVTVTVPSGGRRVRIKVYSSYLSDSASSALIISKIKESSTTLQTGDKTTNSANERNLWNVERIGVPSSGSHTYKVTIASNGGGTTAVNAASTAPAFIHVEII